MCFPEDLNRPSRTITATCTRVSRESIIVSDRKKFRRLSVRERASIQGFPISYEFYASSYSQKIKMIGNAMPPTFAYLIASAMKNIPIDKFKPPSSVKINIKKRGKPPVTKPDNVGKKFSKNRSFKYTAPYLRFKGGVRFEFTNIDNFFTYKFFYGDPKNILEIKLDKKLSSYLKKQFSKYKNVSHYFEKKSLKEIHFDNDELQKNWCQNNFNKNPFKILDKTENLVKKLSIKMNKIPENKISGIVKKLVDPNYLDKTFEENSRTFLSGLIITSTLNSIQNEE